MDITNKDDVNKILDFWFEKKPDYKKWFDGEKYDRYITENFKDILKEAEKGNLLEWLSDKNSYVAMIILLDQMSRHIYRNDKKAYSNDKKALLFTEMGLDLHLDKLNVFEKMFVLMPYQHSENIEDQKLGKLILENQIKLENDPYNQNILKRILFHQKNHYKLIEKFGRFPKRNTILKREPTEDEIDYLDENKY